MRRISDEDVGSSPGNTALGLALLSNTSRLDVGVVAGVGLLEL
jgi:hypothetical protein